MKLFTSGSAVLVSILGSLLLLFSQAALAGGGVATSKHALAGCNGCHAPHNVTGAADAPLWNRALSTQASYTLYDTVTMNSKAAQPSAISKLCLSCHDGVMTGTGIVAGDAANLGANLSNDHPIGMTYDTTADPALKATTSAVTIGSGGNTKAGTLADTLLFAGKVECASCHDVHNTYTALDSNNLDRYMLKVTNAGSAICSTCHNK